MEAERHRWNPALDDESVPLVGEFKYPLEKPLGPIRCTSRRTSTHKAGLTKQILVPCSDATACSPRDGETCFTHYDMWQLNDSEAEVWSTRQEGEPRQIILGEDVSKDDKRRHHLGVAECLRAMRPGERALFTVPPELGYGEEGSFSFPSVPPACWLLADVELIGVKRADEEPMARADMLYEERMQRVKAHRQRGNGFFRGGEPEAAAREYEMALSFLTDDMMMQLHGEYLRAADGEKLSAHLNLCACALKLGKNAQAIDQATRALVVDPKNPKALYRRAKAKHALGQDDEARADLLRAMEMSPGGEDPAVLLALKELETEESKTARARSAVFAGLFAGDDPEDAAGHDTVQEVMSCIDDVDGGMDEKSDIRRGFFTRVGRALGFRCWKMEVA